VRQLGATLDDVHARGVVVGDLRPENVLLTSSGGGRLQASLGRDVGPPEAPGTKPDALVMGSGASSSIAPEQILGQPIDRRTDVYALACIAFEALVGSEPFVRETEAAALEAHVHDPRPVASEVGAAVGHRVDEVLQSGMARDPGARPPSAGAFARALATALEAPAPGSSPRWAAPAVMLALLALGVVGAWALLRGDDPPPEASDGTSAVTVTRTTTTTTGPVPARLALDRTLRADGGLGISYPAAWRVRSRGRSRVGSTVEFAVVTIASGPFRRAPMYMRIVVGGRDDTAFFEHARLSRLLAKARTSARTAFRWKTSFRGARGLRVAGGAGRRADLNWQVARGYAGLGFAFAARNRKDGRWLYGFAVYDTWDADRVRPGRLRARRDTLRAIASSLRWG
jgi:Protein kinase domain